MIFGLILYNKNQKTPSHIRDEVIRGSTLSKRYLSYLSLSYVTCNLRIRLLYLLSSDLLPDALSDNLCKNCFQPVTVSLLCRCIILLFPFPAFFFYSHTSLRKFPAFVKIFLSFAAICSRHSPRSHPAYLRLRHCSHRWKTARRSPVRKFPVRFR